MVSLELCVQCSRVCVHQGWMHTSQKTIASPPLEIWKKHMQWSVVCSVIKFLDSNIFNCCTQWILISKHFQCPCKFLLCSFSYHQTATHAEILHTTQTYSYVQTFDNYLINQQLTLNFRCWEDIYFQKSWGCSGILTVVPGTCPRNSTPLITSTSLSTVKSQALWCTHRWVELNM